MTEKKSSRLQQMKAETGTALHAWRTGAGLPPVAPKFVVSPYRISPIGAHVDHQGGPVLGRTIDQYTVLSFVPLPNQPEIKLRVSAEIDSENEATFAIGATQSEQLWVRYAQAAAAALAADHDLHHGLQGIVRGSLIGAGLSSSASVILAYLHGLAAVNDLTLSKAEYVELNRRVENEFMGLNNGIQDQTAIAFGQRNALLHMQVDRREQTVVRDSDSAENSCFILLYSGFSRSLVGSGFNTRVAECREAARLLDTQAATLSEVTIPFRQDKYLNALPSNLARRARHFYSEIKRVHAGHTVWQRGDWAEFGRLMSQSCQSSINQYECGTQPLIDLHHIAATTEGVYGSRFSGGGYGGCLIMLAERSQATSIMTHCMQEYLQLYPEKASIAHAFIAESEDGIRIETQ